MSVEKRKNGFVHPDPAFRRKADRSQDYGPDEKLGQRKSKWPYSRLAVPVITSTRP